MPTQFTQSCTVDVTVPASVTKQTGKKIGNINQLHNTNFSPAWSQSGPITATTGQTDWQGGSTAMLMVPDAVFHAGGTGLRGVFQGPYGAVGAQYTQSAYFKAAGYNFVTCGPNFVTGNQVVFDLSNGTIAFTGANAVGAITDAGGGWYRCSSTVVATSFGNNAGFQVGSTMLTARDGNWAGDGVSGTYIAGPQLQVSAAPTTFQAQGNTPTLSIVPVTAPGSATLVRATSHHEQASVTVLGALARLTAHLVQIVTAPVASLAKQTRHAEQIGVAHATSLHIAKYQVLHVDVAVVTSFRSYLMNIATALQMVGRGSDVIIQGAEAMSNRQQVSFGLNEDWPITMKFKDGFGNPLVLSVGSTVKFRVSLGDTLMLDLSTDIIVLLNTDTAYVKITKAMRAAVRFAANTTYQYEAQASIPNIVLSEQVYGDLFVRPSLFSQFP